MELIGLATETKLTLDSINKIRTDFVEFSNYYERTFYKREWNRWVPFPCSGRSTFYLGPLNFPGPWPIIKTKPRYRLSACLPVFHQLLHVANGLDWLGPMHVYSQWSMERLCGMITRTAKSRVSANRNMEITLLLTEQKHMLGFVVNDGDWPARSESHNCLVDIEDEDGNLSLAKAFAHRIAVSRPEAVRAPIQTIRGRFSFLGRVRSRRPRGVEVVRIREFMARLRHYDRERMDVPTNICLWRWCCFRDAVDNKKEDFKVTSRMLRPTNNTRNSSVVAYRDSEGRRVYGEVQFFFSTRLPSELQGENVSNDALQPRAWDSETNSEDERTGTTPHHLVLVRQILFELECEDTLVRKIDGGALGVIAAGSIETLIGVLKVKNDEYLTARFTSMIGRIE